MSVFKQFFLGFASPFHSARFLFQKKSLLFLGVIPHILNFILYFWIVSHYVIGKWLLPFLASLSTNVENSILQSLLNPRIFESFIWIVAVLLYGAIGASFVNAIASPVYDYIATKSYESTSLKKVPIQDLGDILDSVISEFTKAVIVFCVFIISIFVHVFAPVLFLLSIWYLGWNSIDRTLLLLNLPLKERLRFGVENVSVCLGLGLWSYIPIISPLLAFTTASAGGMIVAQSKIPYLMESSPGVDF